MAKILLVEDDTDLTNRVRDWFTAEGHTFESVTTGEDALQLLAHFSYDVILLDWNLPGLSGLDVCKRFRQTGGAGSVIFLTGMADVSNKEQGLDMGADDYLTKPFELRELAARIRSLLRRPAGYLKEELTIGNKTLDVKAKTLLVSTESIQLTPTECALLEYLMRHPNRTFGAKDLLKSVWASDREATTDTVRSWIRKLRTKLESAGQRSFVQTVSRSGYMVKDEPGTGTIAD